MNLGGTISPSVYLSIYLSMVSRTDTGDWVWSSDEEDDDESGRNYLSICLSIYLSIYGI